MIKKLIFILLLSIETLLPAQESIPPATVTDFNITVTGISDPTYLTSVFTWTKPYDDSQIIKYEIYNYGDFYSGYDCNLGNCADNMTFNFPYLVAGNDYCFTLKAIDEYNNISDASNEICISPQIYTPINSDIFLSQYYEGENNNKAIEVSVLGGYQGAPSFDASEYSIKINIDGGSSWSEPFQLSGIVEPEKALVIANSNATEPAIVNQADIFTEHIALTFDGNDAIGLFKNDELVDIIGTFNGGNNFFAEDINLLRNACDSEEVSITEYEVKYYPSLWDECPINESCSLYYSNLEAKHLGYYEGFCGLLSTSKDITENKIDISPNPFNDELHIGLDVFEETQIEIFSIHGKRVMKKSIYQSEKINTSDLGQGIFILKISQGNTQITKKLIKV